MWWVGGERQWEGLDLVMVAILDTILLFCSLPAPFPWTCATTELVQVQGVFLWIGGMGVGLMESPSLLKPLNPPHSLALAFDWATIILLELMKHTHQCFRKELS